jgi:Ca-activated chloride channel family protein
MEGSPTISVQADRKLIRAGRRSRRYLRVELRAPEVAAKTDRLPLNLALVLDRSGSMEGPKLEMARAALRQAIQCLRAQDRFSVVTYDDKIDVLLPSSLATPAARAHAERSIETVEARAGTDLCGGWLRGCEQVGLHLTGEELGRCLLLTDGLANQGITDHDRIVQHAAALRERGVTTTTFGVGADFDETLLRQMSNAGGGNFYFIQYPANIPDFLTGEVGTMLQVVVPAAALLVDTSPGVIVSSLNGFPCRREGRSWRVELGSLGSGQSLDPVLSLTFPEGVLGAVHATTVSLADGTQTLVQCSSEVLRIASTVDASRADEICASVVFRYASDEENANQPREHTVERRVVALYAARSAQEALERNRVGDFSGARQVLEGCGRAIAEYVRDDTPSMRAILEDLRARALLYSEDMSALSRKTAHFDATLNLTLRPRSRITP